MPTILNDMNFQCSITFNYLPTIRVTKYCVPNTNYLKLRAFTIGSRLIAKRLFISNIITAG